MRISTPKSKSTFRRPTPLRRKLSQPTPTSTFTSATTLSGSDYSKSPIPVEPKSSVSDSLAICLFGFTRTMFDSEYEEEMRKRAIMAEVLPDEIMWAAWAKNEAPLRQGRGWYPALDRHFLELLVISEIHCLSHPLHGMAATAPGQAERIHRHASRVRRVACERIGAERLHAYCDRVKEAFEAYMHGAWGGAVVSAPQGFEEGDDDVSTSTSEDDSDDDPLSLVSPFSPGSENVTEGEGEGEGGREGGSGSEERGRKREKGEGSVNRMEHPEPKDLPGSPKSYTATIGGEMIGEDPFVDQEMDKEEKELDRIVQELEADGELLKIDLDDVQEGDEDEIPIDPMEKQKVGGMDIDIRIDVKSDSDGSGVPLGNLNLPTSVPTSPSPDQTSMSTSSATADLIKPSMTWNDHDGLSETLTIEDPHEMRKKA